MNGIPQAHSISASIDSKMNNSGAGRLQFPLDTPKYYTKIEFMKFEALGAPDMSWLGNIFAPSAQSVNESNTFLDWAAKKTGLDRSKFGPTPQITTDVVILPLPINLEDLHQVSWEDKAIVPLTDVANIVEGLVPGVGSTMVAGKRYVGLAGLAVNEYQTVIFDRPKFKRFVLNFKLSPRNYEESKRIRDIICTINNAMSPGEYGFLWRFPNMIQITYRPNNGWTYKFKPAVIEGFTINYSGGGDNKKAFYRTESEGAGGPNNPPESVELGFHIMEVEYWKQGDFILESTYSGWQK